MINLSFDKSPCLPTNQLKSFYVASLKDVSYPHKQALLARSNEARAPPTDAQGAISNFISSLAQLHGPVTEAADVLDKEDARHTQRIWMTGSYSLFARVSEQSHNHR